MTLVSFYPDQNEELFKEFCTSIGESFVIFSYKPLDWANVLLITPGHQPPADDTVNIAFQYLSQSEIDESIRVIVDWTICDLSKDKDKLKQTTSGVFVVEEQVKIQDFRLAPFMENLLKICKELNLSGVDRLFSTNPFVIIPKIIKGSQKDLLTVFEEFLSIRKTINSANFTGVIPIFNSVLVCA